MKWTAEHLNAALDYPDSQGVIPDCNGVEIDTRRIQSNDLFLAFRGASVDGHDFLSQAAQKGAVCALVEEFQNNSLAQIKVTNMRKALWRLAAYARQYHERTYYIAITGSVGKTSTRGLMCAAFKTQMSTYSSSGNFNNDLGMPLCLANMGCSSGYDVAIFELGTSNPGELEPLSLLLQPQMAIVLNIMMVHQANFKTSEDIAREKSKIFCGLPRSGVALIPDQTAYKAIFEQQLSSENNIIVYNDPKGDFYWSKDQLYARETGVRLLKLDIELQRFKTNLLALYSAYNAAFGQKNITMLAQGVQHWRPEAGRGKTFVAKSPLGVKVTLIDDSYNASLASMQACLKDLSCAKGARKIAVLGDMKELGCYTLEQHQELIKILNAYQFDAVFLVGDQLVQLADQVDNLVSATLKFNQIIEPVIHYIANDDIIAVKGSLSVGLSQLVARFKMEKSKESINDC